MDARRDYMGTGLAECHAQFFSARWENAEHGRRNRRAAWRSCRCGCDRRTDAGWHDCVLSGQAKAQREHDSVEAKAQRDHDAAESTAQRDHEAAERRQRHAAELLTRRLEWIASWRNELRDAAYEWDHPTTAQAAGNRQSENLVGKPWFESFRAHLTDSDDADELRDDGYPATSSRINGSGLRSPERLRASNNAG